MTEISVTLKGDGSYASPWLVIRGENIKEIHEVLAEAHAQDIFTAVGRADAAYETGIKMGSRLDATTIEVQTGETKGAPAKKAAPKKAAPKKAEPAKAEAPAEAPAAAAPATAPAPAKTPPKPAWLTK